MHTNHAGRVALVTGANHGIGAATARALANHGAAVLLTYLRVQEEADPARPDPYRGQPRRSTINSPWTHRAAHCSSARARDEVVSFVEQSDDHFHIAQPEEVPR